MVMVPGGEGNGIGQGNFGKISFQLRFEGDNCRGQSGLSFSGAEPKMLHAGWTVHYLVHKPGKIH